MKAVIMAGGKGTRLRPLTCDLPKPMVPVLTYPVMEHIIMLLKQQGITEIAVTTFYLPRVLQDYFGDGEKWGVNLHYYIEESPLGTAGSVHNADEFLDETFIVISGDAITDFNLQEGIDFHREKGSDATLILSREEIPLEYGVVMTDEQGQIIRFLEKPNWGQVFSDTINTGIYVLEPEIFNLFDKGEKFDFSKDLFPLMLHKEMNLYGLPLNGYWNDIGNLVEFHKTQFDFLQGRINLPINSARQIGDRIWIEENVDIDNTAILRGPLYIGSGTRIGRNVFLEHSVIGKNNLVQSHSSIKNSVLWDNNYLGRHCELRGTIITDNNKIQDRASIFDHSALGRKVKVGREACIKPGVKIWPEKEIGEKAVVEHSIIWAPRWNKQLFSNMGVIGQGNIDITPEFTAKLASAYGSTLDKKRPVTVSADSYKISNALKRSFTGGLQTTGIDVVDLGDTTTPVARYGVGKLDAQGGVHIRVSYEDPQQIVIEFLNTNGANISSSDQKGIEKKFFAEDYRLGGLDEIGEYSYVTEINQGYLDGILQDFNVDIIRRNLFSVVVDYEYNNLFDILPSFLKKMNCQVLSARNFSGSDLPLSLEERLEISERLVNIIIENEADLGIIIDHNAENLNLVTDSGRVLNRSEHQVLISYILLEKGFDELYLPLNAPRVIADLAEDYGARITYTAVRPQVPMLKYFDSRVEEPPYFYPYLDAVYGLGLVLEKMAEENIGFDELLSKLPEFHLRNVEIPCRWQDKGRIMRHLTNNAGEETELIDGIRFTHDKGWALVIPDSEKPIFHIFAEGYDEEAADSLTGFYQEKLQKLLDS